MKEKVVGSPIKRQVCKIAICKRAEEIGRLAGLNFSFQMEGHGLRLQNRVKE